MNNIFAQFAIPGSGGSDEESDINQPEINLPPPEPVVLSAGLYETGTTSLIKNWDSLIADGDIVVVNKTKLSSASKSLEGDLIVADGIITIRDKYNAYLKGFNGCTGLTKVVLPDSVVDINVDAFNGCTSLETVVMGRGVTTISTGAFQSCTSLKSIYIPVSVRTIGDSSFVNCSSLSDVYYAGSEYDWNYISISANGNDSLNKANIHYYHNFS